MAQDAGGRPRLRIRAGLGAFLGVGAGGTGLAVGLMLPAMALRQSVIGVAPVSEVAEAISSAWRIALLGAAFSLPFWAAAWLCVAAPVQLLLRGLGLCHPALFAGACLAAACAVPPIGARLEEEMLGVLLWFGVPAAPFAALAMARASRPRPEAMARASRPRPEAER